VPVKRGQQVTLQIEELTPKGDGLARVDGVEVVVRGTVPGDSVNAVVGRKRKGRVEARVVEVLQVRLPRREPPCSHFGTCGGCRWQNLSYSDQLQLKDEMVRRSLASRDIFPGEFRPALGSPSSLYYRNKMEFSFGRGAEGDLQIGLHVRERYNRVFDLEACYLQSELSNRVVDSVRRHAVASGLPVYDLRTHEGLLRFLVVREAKQGGGGLMVNLVVSQYPHEGIDNLVHAVTGEVPEITTFVVSLHTGKAQVASGEGGEFILTGGGHIVEECGGLQFQISPQSFFQTNTEQAGNLYLLIRELAGDMREMDVLDLYCGTGGIALHLARESRTVTGIEQTVKAVEDARLNAQRNSIENCTFIPGKAEDVLRESGKIEGKRFDLVVVDPPRAGIHKKVLWALGDLAPAQIIYVSCNAESLADDLAELMLAGYRVSVVQPVDLFPQTPHCEVVAALHRTDAPG